MFNDHELELLISGLPEIDVGDLRANTEYTGYTAASRVVQWFWEIVAAMDKEDLALLVQFVTGTSKVPLDGFKALQVPLPPPVCPCILRDDMAVEFRLPSFPLYSNVFYYFIAGHAIVNSSSYISWRASIANVMTVPCLFTSLGHPLPSCSTLVKH